MVVVAMGVAPGLSSVLTSGCGLAILESSTPRPLQAMSEEQLKAFLEAVKANEGLQEKLKAAGDADAVVVIAKAAGFVIAAEELQRAQAELSDEELEGVAGGGAGVLVSLGTLVLMMGDIRAGCNMGE